MPPKNTRLTRPQFLGAFTKGRRVRGSLFELVVAPSTHLKYAVVVSKKVAPSAVVRNRLRRRVYHILRNVFSETSKKGEYIFIMRAASTSVPTPTLKDTIAKTLATSSSNKKL